MPAVRYVTLAALVLWLAGLLDALAGDVLRERQLAYGCGAVLLIGYLTMKFVGPPPRAFKPRLAIVVLMLLVAAAPELAPRAGRLALVADAALAAVLLFWYSRE